MHVSSFKTTRITLFIFILRHWCTYTYRLRTFYIRLRVSHNDVRVSVIFLSRSTLLHSLISFLIRPPPSPLYLFLSGHLIDAMFAISSLFHAIQFFSYIGESRVFGIKSWTVQHTVFFMITYFSQTFSFVKCFLYFYCCCYPFNVDPVEYLILFFFPYTDKLNDKL